MKGILNIILDRQGNENKGTGYFIMNNYENACQLVQLEGKRIAERALFFDVEKHDELLADPITEE